jgi:DNA repair ATPase RecN
MSDFDAQRLRTIAHRLALLEIMVYRYRSNRWRHLTNHLNAIVAAAQKQVNEALQAADTDYHNLAKEVRSLRVYLADLGYSPDVEPEFQDLLAQYQNKSQLNRKARNWLPETVSSQSFDSNSFPD